MTLTQPFDIDWMVERIREAIRPYPKAAMFQLAEEGFNSLFEQLIACIISIRTYDEVSILVARRLLGRARTPQAMLKLSLSEVLNDIQESTFAERKAEQIIAIAQQIISDYGGELPADPEVLTRFNGVGPKCAHLALGVACGLPYISVDVHVHRVTNRWGYVRTSTPEKTMLALHKQLPEKYWVELNALLVPFGKHICRGTRPRCGHCPVEAMCAQVGVTEAVG
ncbi:MAG TPA: endonuclease III [Trichocoleus sp.]